ncbi:MAG: MerR family DNA-binding transcriptional regulator [Alphaproteobacteria bacterium]|nr:MerR family DNA-binding transcriptional regulator [Alphaproteobacteria bacterium]
MVGDEFFTVTQLAEEFGITARTIRFYEQKGLIYPGRAGATRVYTKRDRARLALILRGKRLGFSLGEIQEYLDLYDADPSQLNQIELLKDKIATRIGELKHQKEDIDQTLGELEDIDRQIDDALRARKTSAA